MMIAKTNTSYRGQTNVASELGFFLLVLAKAALFFAFIPMGLFRLAEKLQPAIRGFDPGWPGQAGGSALMIAAAYLTLRSYLILSQIGKDWPRHPPILLATRYIYSFVRHPFYLGYALIWTGVGLRRGSTAMMLLSLGVYLVLMAYAALVEEPILIRRFGERYRAYQRKVRFFWPHWSALAKGALQPNLPMLLIIALLRPLSRLFWRVRMEGLENLPEEGPLIIVCNHAHMIDAFLVGLCLTRPYHVMGADEIFRLPVLRLLFQVILGAFRKRRWNQDVGALRQAERWLGQGKAVGIFPEGGRNWDGGPVIVGDEVYRFIYHCRVPVVAFSIRGGHEAWPRWAGWRFCFAEISIRIFPALDPKECGSYQVLRERIEERIFSALAEGPVRRGFLASHRGITKVAWACLKCGDAKSMTETATGIACRNCGASWRVTEYLELVDEATGETLTELDYHRLIKERLMAGELRNAYPWQNRVKAYRLDRAQRMKLGQGFLALAEDGKTLRFKNDEYDLTAVLDEVSFAFLSMPGHVVITDRKQTLEFTILNDSPVRWEDYIAAARRNMAPGRKRPTETPIQALGE